jgi:hypothetical protein
MVVRRYLGSIDNSSGHAGISQETLPKALIWRYVSIPDSFFDVNQ